MKPLSTAGQLIHIAAAVHAQVLFKLLLPLLCCHDNVCIYCLPAALTFLLQYLDLTYEACV